MTPQPWLTILGIGEDGLAGLAAPARSALDRAEVIFGGPRHLALAAAGPRGRAWPVPFDASPVLALRGRPIVALASGDPFWFGAGASLAARLQPADWIAHPAPSTFAIAAARLGWRIEEITCLGLHAAPFARARPALAPGARLICLLRDAAAPAAFAQWLTGLGFGPSTLWTLEALGGPRERIRRTTAAGFDLDHIATPVALAIEAAGAPGLPRSPGLAEDLFAHDGAITKAPVRALTLAALAPRPDELLWDLGAGAGSVSVEWCLAGGRAIAIEARPERAAAIAANARAFGLGARIDARLARTPAALAGLPPPAAVFVGGGFDAGLFAALSLQARGARLVVNGVTLETEALLADLHARHGGELLRIDIARAAPLGRLRGWIPARPVTQWSATL